MYFKNVIYFCDGKAEFSAVISPAFSLVIVTVLSLLLHFIFFSSGILWWIGSLKEWLLFKIEIFCNIINVFTLTFYQFNASLLNKSINKKNLIDPEFFE